MRFLIVSKSFRVLGILERAWPRSSVVHMSDLGVGLAIAREEDVDTVILEIPPEHAELQNALFFIRRVRAVSHVPIIVLSHIDTEEDAAEILNSGADRYITKPVADRVLVAHIKATLRLIGSESHA